MKHKIHESSNQHSLVSRSAPAMLRVQAVVPAGPILVLPHGATRWLLLARIGRVITPFHGGATTGRGYRTTASVRLHGQVGAAGVGRGPGVDTRTGEIAACSCAQSCAGCCTGEKIVPCNGHGHHLSLQWKKSQRDCSWAKKRDDGEKAHATCYVISNQNIILNTCKMVQFPHLSETLDSLVIVGVTPMT